MAYPYVIVTRSNGTILTAAIYNADHQAHVTGNIPVSIDDYSVGVTEMRTVTDPGGVGTESLATTLAGELERLRFTINQIKGTTQWYEDPATTLLALAANFRVLEFQVFS